MNVSVCVRSPSGVVGVPAVLQRHRRLPGVRHLHLHDLRISWPRGHMAQVPPASSIPRYRSDNAPGDEKMRKRWTLFFFWEGFVPTQPRERQIRLGGRLSSGAGIPMRPQKSSGQVESFQNKENTFLYARGIVPAGGGGTGSAPSVSWSSRVQTKPDETSFNNLRAAAARLCVR